MLEKEFALKVVEWLQDQKWTVYQEVGFDKCIDGVADIVAVMSNRVWIIEVKANLCLRVLSQAERWRSYANWRSIAIPSRRNNHEDLRLTKTICSYLGIGIITVPQHSGSPSVLVESALNRRSKSKELIKQLKPEHQTYSEAGSAGNRRWTSFKSTSRDVVNYIGKHPGCTLKDLVEAVPTHYNSKSTAKACIVEYIQKKVIPGVKIEREGKQFKLYPI
jgi:hypothetical protein